MLRCFYELWGCFLPIFFIRCVKRLCLTVSISPHDARTILQTCIGVSSLACWVDFIGSQPIVLFQHLFHPLPLRRLSIEVAHFRRLQLSECVWTHSLTCLDLVFWREDSLVIPELQLLPALSRLALHLRHRDVDEGSLVYILATAPALQILVLIVDEDELERFENTARVDLRIVCMPHPDTVPDWEAPHRGLPDMWSHAEEMVGERRRVAANQVCNECIFQLRTL